MATYLTISQLKLLATIPPSYIDEIEKQQSGWVASQIESTSRWIDSRLRKRYATPFNPYDFVPPEEATPPTIQEWITRIVTLAIMQRRGINNDDLQYETYKERHDEAKAEVLEAANSDEGWFDLPLRTDANGTLISQGTPRAYSEQSPYVSTDRQQSIGSSEDSTGTGSGYGG